MKALLSVDDELVSRRDKRQIEGNLHEWNLIMKGHGLKVM
jgi:hypothetical protein